MSTEDVKPPPGGNDGGNGTPQGAPPAPGMQQLQLGPVELLIMLLNRHRQSCVCGGVRFTQAEIEAFAAGRPWNVQIGSDEEGPIASVTPNKPASPILIPKLQMPPGFGSGPRTG